MEKVFTIELDQQREMVELHLNKKGAEFLRDVLNKLIENDTFSDHHFMSPDWGGDELSSEKQNLSDGTKLIHLLKILYSKE
jgi:Immunity protein 32